MRRRALLAAAALGGCSIIPQRPYLERREWPLLAPRPATRPARSGAPLLLVRALRAAPGLGARGLRTLQPDGSVRTDPYEEWAVPPADAVEDQLRRWLSASGMFAAVLAPGSGARADLVLEGELLALVADLGQAASRAAIGVVLLDNRAGPARLRLQAEIVGQSPLPQMDAAGVERSACLAVAAMLANLETRLRAALG